LAADELAHRPVEEIVQRVTAIMGKGTPAIVSTAVMGGEQVPKVCVSEAFVCNEIVADEIAGKSEAQRKQWTKVKRRAINSFIAVVEDKAMVDITRDDARAFHRYWLDRVAPKGEGARKALRASLAASGARVRTVPLRNIFGRDGNIAVGRAVMPLRYSSCRKTFGGKSGGYRTSIAYSTGRRAVFLFGFAKNQRDNLTPVQLADLTMVGRDLLSLTDRQINEAVAAGQLQEVRYGEED
jgi:hypothetical protein